MSTQDHSSPAVYSKKRVNPFYVLLGILGAAFVVTGVAYGLMMYQALQPVGPASETTEHPLYRLMSQYGNTLLVAELVLLAICTVAAIKTDDYWVGRNGPVELSHDTTREVEDED